MHVGLVASAPATASELVVRGDVPSAEHAQTLPEPSAIPVVACSHVSGWFPGKMVQLSTSY